MAFLNSQDQKKSDSLKVLFHIEDSNTQQLEYLFDIVKNETNPDTLLFFSSLYLEKIRHGTSYNHLRRAYSGLGNAYQLKGNYSEALSAYYNSLKFAKLSNDSENEGALLISIADTYSLNEDSNNALQYYRKGIEVLRQAKDSVMLGSALLNQGDEYFNSENFDKALVAFQESGEIFDEIGYEMGRAYNYGNVGMVYAELGEDQLAEDNINKAIAILEKAEDYYPISVYLTYLSDIYLEKGNNDLALSYLERSLNLAKSYNLKEQIRDTNLKLSQLYADLGDFKISNNYLKEHIIYKDSVMNIKTVRDMADQKTAYEVGLKQSELDLEIQKRKTNRIIMYSTAGATLFIGIFAFGLYRRNTFIKKTNAIISKEKQRSENLLLNILPEETAQELKEHGRVEAKRFESVTVLFSDFKGFTSYAEQLEPEELVSTVDYYFSKFDAIIESYGLEKIKTVGDAYMVAGGLPFPTEDHALKMTQAAFDMAEFVKSSKQSNDTSATFDIRIGINTGPVVAGVVGSKKFAYDIWGDTVNIAARMESNSEPGKINVSESTFQHIQSYFKCEFRGELEAKNRGKLKMYFVETAL